MSGRLAGSRHTLRAQAATREVVGPSPQTQRSGAAWQLASLINSRSVVQIHPPPLLPSWRNWKRDRFLPGRLGVRVSSGVCAALMVGMADTGDLKSLVLRRTCGFDSRSAHKPLKLNWKSVSVLRRMLLVRIRSGAYAPVTQSGRVSVLYTESRGFNSHSAYLRCGSSVW